VDQYSQPVLAALIRLTEREGRSPTFKEVAAEIGRQVFHVQRQVVKLERDGYLKRLGGARGLRILKRPDGSPYPYFVHDLPGGGTATYTPESSEARAARRAADVAREMGQDAVADEILRRAGLLT
jgi:DNA-binding Lrp family transcriptional regulator